MSSEQPRFAFFGTPAFAVFALEELKKAKLPPALVVTAPDRPKGRGLRLSPPPVKTWAERERIPFIQPEKLDEAAREKLAGFDLFAVVAYGKILKQEVLALPKHGTLNVHPSLLPKLRGPSPVEGAILEGARETGVSILLLDEKMDHGPVVMREKMLLSGDERAPELREKLARLGGSALAKVIPDGATGTLAAVAQDDAAATYTNLVKKEDGLLDLADAPEKNYRKFRAYCGSIGTHFFAKRHGKDVRVIVKDAALENGEFSIKKVLPEGGREMPYGDFVRGL
ncbi:MAG: methionyl-tRNA formyltransferase [bacterium]|nr:methionyl-tRNA formyltransferase [bacterium]